VPWERFGLANTEQQVALGLILAGVRRHEEAGGAQGATLLPEEHCVRLVLAGTAGTGKSYVAHLAGAVVRAVGGSTGAARLTAPTGVASSLLHGETIHSLLGLMSGADDGDGEECSGALRPLAGAAKRNLQDVACACTMLLVDEMSMLKPAELQRVSQRLQEGRAHRWPEASKRPFGGIAAVVICGDFGQLPPVKSPNLYDEGGDGKGANAKAAKQGAILYKTFDQVVFLTKMVRAAGGPCSGCPDHPRPEGVETCTRLPWLLEAMRNGTLVGDAADKAWRLLITRYVGDTREGFPSDVQTLSEWNPSQAALFDGPGTLRLVPTRRQAQLLNTTALENQQAALMARAPEGREHAESWATALCVRGGKSARLSGGEGDDAGGVTTKTWVLPGSDVMILSNIAVKWKLFNGALGEVQRVVFAEGQRPSADGAAWPLYVEVRVPGYCGPRWREDRPRDVIPLGPVKARGRHGRREGWPFKACTASTVHKAQAPPHPYPLSAKPQNPNPTAYSLRPARETLRPTPQLQEPKPET
jgi:hypothetical protein